MIAEIIANELKDHGFTVLSSTEGNEVEDGAIELTKEVHIQIPTYGSKMCVVVKHKSENKYGSSTFMIPRTELTDIITDLNGVLA